MHIASAAATACPVPVIRIALASHPRCPSSSSQIRVHSIVTEWPVRAPSVVHASTLTCSRLPPFLLGITVVMLWSRITFIRTLAMPWALSMASWGVRPRASMPLSPVATGAGGCGSWITSTAVD